MNKLMTGTQEYTLDPFTHYVIQADDPKSNLCFITEDGEYELIAMGKNIRGTVKPDQKTFVFNTGENAIWAIDTITPGDRHEHPDPDPVEVTLMAEESLEAKVKRFIRENMSAYYSAKEDAGTWEEETDFEDTEGDNILSPYELQAMVEEELRSHSDPAPTPPIAEPSASAGEPDPTLAVEPEPITQGTEPAA